MAKPSEDALINDFAIRCFRDTADYDYITARMSFRARLFPQFLWAGLQTIEKYLKCVLLLNRIPAKKIRHDLSAATILLEKHAPFELRLRQTSKQLIEHLDTYGRFRYFETPFHSMGDEIIRLDMAVWDLRRYCQILNYEIDTLPGPKKSMLDMEIEALIRAESKPPQEFFITNGKLEQIIADKTHPAREPLLWQNAFFGQRKRTTVRLKNFMHASNSPASLHPEILNVVSKFVYFPDHVATAYRQQLQDESAS